MQFIIVFLATFRSFHDCLESCYGKECFKQQRKSTLSDLILIFLESCSATGKTESTQKQQLLLLPICKMTYS